jgi:predicted RNA binding protein YcfA (HicA-like mRNA interferase family)
MKLPTVSGEQTIKALTKAGFIVVRQKGSHVRLEKEIAEGIIKLTVPLHETLKRKTLHMILKQAGLSVEEFIELLK